MDVVDDMLLQLPEYLTPAEFGNGIDTGWRKRIHSQSPPCTPNVIVASHWRNVLTHVRAVVNPAALRPNRDLGIHTSGTMTHAHTVCNIEAGGGKGGAEARFAFGSWVPALPCGHVAQET